MRFPGWIGRNVGEHRFDRGHQRIEPPEAGEHGTIADIAFQHARWPLRHLQSVELCRGGAHAFFHFCRPRCGQQICFVQIRNSRQWLRTNSSPPPLVHDALWPPSAPDAPGRPRRRNPWRLPPRNSAREIPAARDRANRNSTRTANAAEASWLKVQLECQWEQNEYWNGLLDSGTGCEWKQTFRACSGSGGHSLQPLPDCAHA